MEFKFLGYTHKALSSDPHLPGLWLHLKPHQAKLYLSGGSQKGKIHSILPHYPPHVVL